MNIPEPIKELSDAILVSIVEWIDKTPLENLTKGLQTKRIASKITGKPLEEITFINILNLLPLIAKELSLRIKERSSKEVRLERTRYKDIEMYQKLSEESCHRFVKSWVFAEEDSEEAFLANQLSIVAEKNGLSANDFQHIFPVVLRILKSKSKWSE